METRLQPPLAPPEPPPIATHPGRPRRWPRRLLLAGALLLVLALVAGGTWVARYDPLATGSIGYAAPAGLGAKVVDVSWALPNPPLIYRIPAVTGMTFDYRFSIRNDGPVSITIKDVGIPAERSGNVVNRHPVRVMANAYAGPTGSPWIGFRPITLAPGQEGAIEMQATFQGCLPSLDKLSWSDEEMKYSVLGITRHETFTPDIVIVLVGTPSSVCPASPAATLP